MNSGRLIIVANRLPVTVGTAAEGCPVRPSSGGLATALGRAHAARAGSLWVGWPGEIGGLPRARRAEVLSELEALATAPLELAPEEVAGYYDGFANGVLWPLLHYLLDKVNLDAEADWLAYRAVNERFADLTAAHYRPGDQIWVHDYQLALVPALLRRRLPRARIGYFLHVPFPAADVFRILPWREEILRGLLGADLVGFQAESYRRNFQQAAVQVLGAERERDALLLEGRTTATGVFPIGIDVAAFEAAAASPEVAERVAQIRAAAGGKRIVLGIDRLDYTKGLPRRLLAIDRLLEASPELRDRLHVVQLAVPTRERVDAYADLRRTVNELVGRVNSRHGSATAAPIHLLYRSVGFTELVALYRAADVMLVTPLRDGMNLVAKEYVASRCDGDGVLVLSEFAGAACELPQALQVNPYDLSAVADALRRALAMPAAEAAVRMAAMRTMVRAQDIGAWTDSFCADLGRHQEGGAGVQVSGAGAGDPDELAQAIARARAAPRRLILLDYDGTLVPLAATPDLAVPDADVRRLLAALASRPDTAVHILTGRDRPSIERWLGDLPLGLHAEHGFWSRARGEREWRANFPPPEDWKKPVLAIMQECARRTAGCLVEEKTTAVAFHYRLAHVAGVAGRLHELREALTPLLLSQPVELLHGACVLEVRPRGVHKGLVVTRLCQALDDGGASLLAAGDDLTDEDVFHALPGGAISIKIGAGASAARWRAEGPRELHRHLWGLVGPDLEP